ncbi:MAG: alpha-2-macroglobulin family protein [candidate division KSB1 bacterium]|nr:alpha-2-macroglobulin family protein [candidate division KSB1 bacterium]
MARVVRWAGRMLLLVLPVAAQAQLRVVSVTPPGALSDMAQAREIVVTFSEPMVAVGEIPDSLHGPLHIEPPVRGIFRWLGSMSVAFQPKEPLPAATRFHCTVPAGVRALSGNELKQPYQWYFETPRPRLIDHNPYDRQKHVDPAIRIWLIFNQPVALTIVQDFIRLQFRGEQTAPVIIRYPEMYELQREVKEGRRLRRLRLQFEQKSLADLRKHILILQPQAPLPRGETVRVRVLSGLHGLEGPLPSTKEFVFEFQVREAFRFTGLKPKSPVVPNKELTFQFTNPVAFNQLLRSLSFAPSVEVPAYYFDWRYATSNLSVYLPLKPRTHYRFTIADTLKNEWGEPLRTTVRGEIETGDYQPWVDIPTGFGVLENAFPPRLPIEILNVQELPISLGALSPEELVDLARLSKSGRLFRSGAPFPVPLPIDSVWHPQAEVNQRYRRPLALKPALGQRRSGIVALQLRFQHPDEDGPRYYKSIVQYTSMAVTGKFSPAENTVFVTRFEDARPVAGATIEIRSAENRILWTGRTNRQGIARTPGWAALGLTKTGWRDPLMWVFVYQGQDTAFCRSDWNDGLEPWRFNIDYDWSPQPAMLEADLQTDRGLYRAGETVYIKGIVRMKDGHGEWHVPISPMLQLLVQDARGEEILKKEIGLNDFAAFDDSLKIGRVAPLGLYWMTLSWKRDPGPQARWLAITSRSFRVEAFRPAEFKVEMIPVQPPFGRDEYIAGNRLRAKVQARYLFGAPMKNAPFRWTLQMSPFTFHYKQWPEYRFRADPVLGEPMRPHSRVLAAEKDTLDANGEAEIETLLTVPYAYSGAQVLIEATVTGPSRQQISGRTAVKVHRGDFEIGLRVDGYLFETGKAVACSLLVVRPDGQPLPGQDVQVNVYRIHWNSVRKAGVGGRYSWVTEKVVTRLDSMVIRSQNGPRGFEITPPKPGYYVIEASARDGQGRLIVSNRDFYASGAEFVAWARRDDDLIQLLPDREQYAPGDTARILVQSPYERVRALITVERETILDAWIEALRGSAVTIRVPIRRNYLPNVYVSVALLKERTARQTFSEKGDDLGKPQFKIGYARLRVSPESRHLRVRLKTDRNEYRPGQIVNLELESTLPDGRRMPVEYTIAVVDAGVLNLIGYRLRDPFEQFYRPRPLAVRTVTSLIHLIEQRHYGEKGEPPGGGAGREGGRFGLRTRFRALAYWNPALRSDHRGRARVSFTLPDNLTTFRIMVIAHSQGSDFGGAQTDIVVNKPLLLLASGPRFVRVGDRFKAGAVVTNNSGFVGECRVRLSAENMNLQGRVEARFQLSPGESREVLFDLEAQMVGQVMVTVEAELRNARGTETDALMWGIPVQFPFRPVTLATFGETDSLAREALQVPDKVFRDSSHVQVSAASTALVGLQESVRYLVEYPYGCLEQRLSRVLPVVFAEPLLAAFTPDAMPPEHAREIVQETLDELLEFQQPDGGFALWKSGTRSHPFASAYALWALALAQQRNYAIPEKLLKRAVRYGRRLLRQMQPQREAWPWNDARLNLASRVLMYYALGLLEKPDPHYGEVLFKERDRMPVFAKAFLLQGMKVHEAPLRAQILLAREIMNAARIEARTVHFEEDNERALWACWSSSVRTTALATWSLLQGPVEFPFAGRTVRWLLQQRRDGRWRNTQENVFAMLALSYYFETAEAEEPDFMAEIQVVGLAVLSHAVFKGRTEKVVRQLVPFAQLPGLGRLPVEIRKRGTGRLYYGLSLRYFPLVPQPVFQQGISLSKTFEVIDGRQLDDSTFAAGSLIKVTLSLSTPQERYYVVVDDPLPAGFEAVNLRFQTEARATAAGQLREEGARFNRVEKHDDRVLAFADYLPPGVHRFSYLVRATGKGTFVTPPPRAEEMYAPEIFGTAPTARIRIQ